jgi:hypothetical protein
MSKRLSFRPGDRVSVRSGLHINAAGTVLRREGTVWIVRLDSGATRNCMSSSLTRLGGSRRTVARS